MLNWANLRMYNSMQTIYNSKIIKNTFLILFMMELASFFGWLVPLINNILFFLILFSVLFLSLKKIEYGFYILFAELFLTSYGYLVQFQASSFSVSLRIGIFIILMAVWFYKYAIKDYQLNLKEIYQDFKESLSNNLNKTLLLLAVVLLWGVIWGAIKGNTAADIFFDFNNWLYLALVLPLNYVWHNSKNQEKPQKFFSNILNILLATSLWLSIKSLILFYIFTHQINFALPEVYKWIRDSRVGEITFAGGGYWRIFIQSQLYVLIAFLIFLSQKLTCQNKKQKTAFFVILSLFLSTILISISRSFWVGLAAGVGFYFLILFVLKQDSKIKKILKQIVHILFILILSLFFVFVVINLPPKADVEVEKTLNNRISSSGPASSSRLNQLEPLFKKIAKHPIIGSGFATSVTYRSLDPRIINSTAGKSGQYTTYAFEWGYFDIWLKIGLFGLLVYLYLIWQIMRKMAIIIARSRQNGWLTIGLSCALIALLAVNVFSPYLNHPLGIGYILILLLYLKDETK